MSTRLSFKLGSLEIECEGAEEFVERTVVPLIESHAQTAVPNHAHLAATQHSETVTSSGIQEMSMKTIAIKLNAKSGPDLVYCAAASLSLVKKKETFSRAEIHQEIKDATGFYDENTRKGLSKSINSQIKGGVLIEVRTDTFSVKNEALNKMRHELTDS